jgi:hypothetical protein
LFTFCKLFINFLYVILEDVAAFTETGGVIYATTTIEEQILTEMAAPIIHADDWQAEDMDDAAMFLDPNMDLQQPGPSTNDIISEVSTILYSTFI